MRRYRTLETVILYTGEVGLLNKKQVKVRSHKLKPVPGKDDVYEIAGEVHFKAGEEIGLNNPDKSTEGRLECLDPETEKPKRKKSPVNTKAKPKPGKPRRGRPKVKKDDE